MASNMPKTGYAWRTQADVMDDLWAFSELEGVGNRNSNEPMPPTILEYRARMAANNKGSVYDPPEADDGITHIISGRGRGAISIILKPGVSALSDQEVEEDVRRRLRQVSGLGYSNAMIEQHYRDVMAAKEEGIPKTTNSNTPFSIEKDRSSSSCSSSSNASHTTPTENATPLPLSVMRKKAEEEWKNKKELEANKAKALENALGGEIVNGNGTTSNESNERPSIYDTNIVGVRYGSNSVGSWGRGKPVVRNFPQNSDEFVLNTTDFPALQ